MDTSTVQVHSPDDREVPALGGRVLQQKQKPDDYRPQKPWTDVVKMKIH